MTFRPPFLCSCGRTVPGGTRCACQLKRDRERKARFDRTRPNARARGYTREWERERTTFLQAHPVCLHCGVRPATIVHHTTPHRGDMRLFWNRALWMPACQPCHDGPLQAAERRP